MRNLPFSELRRTLRRLRKAPAFSATVVLVLACSLGISTALFSFINALILRPETYKDQPDLIRIALLSRGQEVKGAVLAPSLTTDLLATNNWKSLQLGGYARDEVAVSIDGAVRVLPAERVAGAYFQLANVVPLRGRLIRPEDCEPAAPQVAVISARLWRVLQGDGVDPLWRPVVIAGQSTTIVGVAPADFFGLGVRGVSVDLWVASPPLQVRHVFGRLRDETFTIAQADAEVASRVRAARDRDATTIGVRKGLHPSQPIGVYVAGTAALGLTALVAVVACASIANVLLARIMNRRAELYVRMTLGASLADIRRLISTEIHMLLVCGGALSVIAAMLTTWSVLGLVQTPENPALDLRPDWRVLTFAAVATLIVVIGVTRFVAIHVFRDLDLAGGISTAGLAGSTSSDSSRRHLLGIQVSGATTLIVLAVALFRGATVGLAPAKGFQPVGASLGWLDHRHYGNDVEMARATEKRILDRLQELGGIDVAAVASTLPVEGRGQAIQLKTSANSAGRPVWASMVGVSPAFFDAFGLSKLSGRDFSAHEMSPQRHVGIVNEATALALWSRPDVVGERVRLVDARQPTHEPATLTIVGVVSNTSSLALGMQGNRILYVPIDNLGLGRVAVIARSINSPDASVLLLRRALNSQMRGAALQDISSVSNAVERTRGGRITSAALTAGMGLIAALIAIVGVYGVSSLAATKNKRECGVLLALGANRRRVLLKLAHQNGVVLLRSAGLGLVVAAPIALYLRRYLWNLQPSDWAIVLAVPIMVVFVGAVAAFVPFINISRRPLVELLRPD